MKQAEAIGALSALAQETRLGIVRYLVGRGEEGASAGEIARAVEAGSSRASFHLSALENAGVVRSERRSRHIVYRARFDRIGELISFLLNDCCDGHPDIVGCCLSDGC